MLIVKLNVQDKAGAGKTLFNHRCSPVHQEYLLRLRQ